MRFSLLAPLLFVTSITAAPIDTTQSDASVMTRAVTGVANSLKASIAAVKGLTSAPPGVDLTNYEHDVENKAAAVNTALQSGAANIRRGPDVTAFEGTGMGNLFSEVQRLTSQSTQSYVDARKLIVRTQGGREAILRILNDHLASAGEFGDACKAKLPIFNSAVGGYLSERSQTELKRAIQAYKS